MRVAGAVGWNCCPLASEPHVWPVHKARGLPAGGQPRAGHGAPNVEATVFLELELRSDISPLLSHPIWSEVSHQVCHPLLGHTCWSQESSQRSHHHGPLSLGSDPPGTATLLSHIILSVGRPSFESVSQLRPGDPHLLSDPIPPRASGCLPVLRPSLSSGRCLWRATRCRSSPITSSWRWTAREPAFSRPLALGLFPRPASPSLPFPALPHLPTDPGFLPRHPQRSDPPERRAPTPCS